MNAAGEPKFFEIAVEGHFERTHGLVLGLFLGSGAKGRIYFGHEESITASFGERLRAAVGWHAPICHVIADSVVRDLLERSATALAAHETRIAEIHPVRSAAFEFAFRAYAPRYTADFKALVAALPKGLKLEGTDPEEHLDVKAVGVEIYAPAHAYEAEADGRVSGPVDLVIEARRRFAAHPLVKAERIELELEPAK